MRTTLLIHHMAMGLPRRPRAIDTVLPHDDVPGAKRAALERIARSRRPFVWCDDREAADVDVVGAGAHLVIRPQSRQGLTPAHVEQVWAFVTAATGSSHVAAAERMTS
ncbi:hypothetical protein LO763_19785 [Glycomyces sp. A-F 0318]|uniref:hypothetical protein n=1 Tax=Glycomyces amatae TaxID=2881355 RepID=UPI001E4C68D0|nr:hypothetical protein [Glycomyces amatae]MCD0445854.1 hypothetical protein [Glycomyces amatae]